MGQERDLLQDGMMWNPGSLLNEYDTDHLDLGNLVLLTLSGTTIRCIELNDAIEETALQQWPLKDSIK